MSDERDHTPSPDEAGEAAAIDVAAVLDAVAVREAGGAGDACALADRLGGDDLELLGLLAYGPAPVAPSSGLRARVMAAIDAGGETPARRPPAAAAVPPLRRREPPARWLLPLAATLAVVSILFSGWLSLRVADQRATIAELSLRLEETRRQAEELALAHDDVVLRSRELTTQLARVTAPGIEVCPLRPTAKGPVRAHGLMFIADDQGVWYLRLSNLPPAPEGAVYMVWFFGEDGGTTPGGAVRSFGEGGAPLSWGRVPEPRGRSRGAAVTVETAADVAAPTGPMVLFGDEKMDLL